MRDEFNNRRKFIVKRLNEIKGIRCTMPKGAIYAFPNVSGSFNKRIRNSTEFSNELLDKELVGVIPGEACGSSNNIRITYASSFVELTEGMDRIERFVKSLD